MKSYCYEYPHPAVATDVALFAVNNKQLTLLLIQRKHDPYQGKWALPGGYLEIDEDLEAGALRELQEETGIQDVSIKQLHAFGQPDRDPRERVITVVYYGLVADNVRAEAASDAQAADWFPLSALPPLAFDHDKIINIAQQRIRSDYPDIV